jgi:hypothetical protein
MSLSKPQEQLGLAKTRAERLQLQQTGGSRVAPLAVVLARFNHITQDVFRIWSDRRYVQLKGKNARWLRGR